jgi:hypothetical protein
MILSCVGSLALGSVHPLDRVCAEIFIVATGCSSCGSLRAGSWCPFFVAVGVRVATAASQGVA